MATRFQAAFGGLPSLWIQAPGRIRLFGHPNLPTSGLSLAFAVDRYVEIAVSPTSGPGAMLSIDTEEVVEADGKFDEFHWAAPMFEAVHAFKKHNLPTPAVHAAFTGTLPSAAGIGASSALTTAMAMALDHLAGLHLEAFEMARLCGLPDMAPILLAKHECALKLDGLTGEHSCIPMRTSPYLFLIAYVPLHLTPFEIHAAQSREGSIETWQAAQIEEENRHILEAEKCLLAGDLAEFGRLLNHASRPGKKIRRFHSRQSETLMELASKTEGFLGGTYLADGPEVSVVSLVQRDSVSGFTNSIRKGFRHEFGADPSVIECQPSDGASVSEGMDGLEAHPGWAQAGSRASPAGFGSRHPT